MKQKYLMRKPWLSPISATIWEAYAHRPCQQSLRWVLLSYQKTSSADIHWRSGCTLALIDRTLSPLILSLSFHQIVSLKPISRCFEKNLTRWLHGFLLRLLSPLGFDQEIWAYLEVPCKITAQLVYVTNHFVSFVDSSTFLDLILFWVQLPFPQGLSIVYPKIIRLNSNAFLTSNWSNYSFC